MSGGPAGAVFVLAVAGLAAVLIRSPAVRVLAGRLPRMPSQQSFADVRPLSRPDSHAAADVEADATAGSPPLHGSNRSDPVLVWVLAGLVACGSSLPLIGSAVRPALSRSLAVIAGSGLPGALPLMLLVSAIGLRARRRTRRRRRAALARRSVIRAAEVLVAELQAGAPALDALAAASADLPDLSAVTAAAHLGGEVPIALVALSRRPGLSGLRQLAAAWAVSSETGSGLAATVERLVEALRDDEATQDETEVALATPRATARLLAVLPLAGLGLGTAVGADPWGFLTRSPAGLVIAGAGVLLAGVGLEWVERLADRVAQTGAGDAPGRRGHPPPEGAAAVGSAPTGPGSARPGSGRPVVVGAALVRPSLTGRGFLDGSAR